MNAAMFSRKICQFELQPCRNSSGGRPSPPAARVEHVDAAAQQVERPLLRAPVDAEPRRVVPVGVGRVGTGPQQRVPRHRGELCASRRHVTATVSTAAAVNIAIDIDSTLHHYWDQLSDASRRRFGIALPYEDQVTWGITLLRPEQVRACVEETHTEARVLAAEPYPGAVEAVRGWHGDGHFIHITSHRAVSVARRHGALAAQHRPAVTTSSTAPTTRSTAARRSGSTC